MGWYVSGACARSTDGGGIGGGGGTRLAGQLAPMSEEALRKRQTSVLCVPEESIETKAILGIIKEMKEMQREMEIFGATMKEIQERLTLLEPDCKKYP